MRYVETKQIKISALAMSEYKLRSETEKKGMDRLRHSLNTHGLIHAVAVRKNPDPSGSEWVLVAGHRRSTAAALEGWDTIRAEVWEATDQEASDPSLFEWNAENVTIVSNVVVVPLSLLELGTRIKRWRDDFGLEPNQIADILDEDVTTVEDSLKLSVISESAQEIINAHPDTLTLSALFAVAEEAPKLPEDAQVKLVNWLVDQSKDKTAAFERGAVKKLATAAKREAKLAKPSGPGRPIGAKTRSDIALARRLFRALQRAEEGLELFKVAEKPRFISYSEMTELGRRSADLGAGWANAVEELKRRLTATAGTDDSYAAAVASA